MGLQCCGVVLVGCCLVVIEQFGGGENEYFGIDRNNLIFVGVGGSQCGVQCFGDWGVDVVLVGDYDCICLGEKFRIVVGYQVDVVGSVQWFFIDGGDGELVLVVVYFWVWQVEDFYGYVKFKGVQVIVGEGDYLMM